MALLWLWNEHKLWRKKKSAQPPGAHWKCRDKEHREASPLWAEAGEAERKEPKDKIRHFCRPQPPSDSWRKEKVKGSCGKWRDK